MSIGSSRRASRTSASMRRQGGRVWLWLSAGAGEAGPRRPAARWLALTIEDDGCGGVDGKATEGEGLGLIGMRERVMALGGRLETSTSGAERGFRAPGHDPLRGRARSFAVSRRRSASFLSMTTPSFAKATARFWRSTKG